MFETKLPDRVASKIEVDASGCWIWTGAKDRGGYGHLKWERKLVRAHRLVFMLYMGYLPKVLDHRCGVRACVNPDHLRPVTIKQNSENRVARRGSESGVRGVTRHVASGKWQVRVQHDGKMHSGGTFWDLDDARAAAVSLRNKLFTHNDSDRPPGVVQ